MKNVNRILVLFLCLWSAVCALGQTAGPGLRGTVTDPSGALVPNALVQLRGPGGEQRKTTDANGQYAFPSLAPGKYQVRFIAKGFSVSQKQDVEISGATVLDGHLSIEAEAQVVNVEDEANRVSADPSANGSALVLREKELAALSDDPDELSQQLQAMAGPGAGPSGGQIYIDGFTGGQMPPKSSIREIRINSNPFSPEYDRPGFGRIEILTKPGTDFIRGQAFFQFNNQDFNSRSPLLNSSLPEYQQKFFGLNLSGPIKKQKASFGFDFEHRSITENAFVLATTLDSSFQPQTVNQAILTPQTRTSFTPRLDYMINTNNTLVARYQYTRIGADNQGVGDFSLLSQAYNQASTEHTAQLTETAILSTSWITETRFQFMRSTSLDSKAQNTPAITVQGAFTGGGALVGNSGNTKNALELSNISTYNHGTHTIKWGGRARESFNDDTSMNNFNGSYTFFGGQGPALDANNQPIAGTSVDLTALQVYQRTLLFQSLGYSAAQITALGGGASLFTLNAGTALTSVRQFDIGLFANDDWRMKPNLTLSYGLRYETQSNIGDHGDWAPRVALAWGIDGGANRQAKTVLRVGAGVFYDRITDTTVLSSLRYNGLTQQSYQITNPSFFPTIPSVTALAASRQPQSLQVLYSGIKAPRNYQANIGVDRQINKYARISVNYITSRGVHLLRSVDINAPVNGIYPYSDKQPRFLSESVGFSRTNQLFISPNVNYKKLFLFGFYALSYGRDDNEGQPANPYDLRAEWGPSTFADVRHRGVIGTNIPLWWKLSISPFIVASSGTPYNITTGRNVYGDGVTSARPALVTTGSCTGANLVYEAGFGCFNLSPAAGTPAIERNYGRGPSSTTVNLRLARTWSFGRRGESGPANNGMMGPGGGGPPPGGGGGGGGGMRGGGGPPPGGGPGGPGGPGGMFGGQTGFKYNLTLSISARNALNHPNFAAPSGDLSSPYFGVYRSLTGGFGPPGMSTASSTYNRKIDIQLRFSF